MDLQDVKQRHFLTENYLVDLANSTSYKRNQGASTQ